MIIERIETDIGAVVLSKETYNVDKVRYVVEFHATGRGTDRMHEGADRMAAHSYLAGIVTGIHLTRDRLV